MCIVIIRPSLDGGQQKTVTHPTFSPLKKFLSGGQQKPVTHPTFSPLKKFLSGGQQKPVTHPSMEKKVMMINLDKMCQASLASLFVLATSGAVAQQAGDISVVQVKGNLPSDPLAPEWQQAPVQDVVVMPQQITPPQLALASIDKISAQALTDGQSISWRVSWQDEASDANVDVSRFPDAVALEFPLVSDASPLMGHRGGGKVQILYWKGLWQKDKDEGFQDVQDVHPNVWSDLYWFAEGKAPHRVPDDFKNPLSHQWFIAKQAGNPTADFNQIQTAQELVAEGWGTLTPQQDSVTTATGVWKDGRWTVVFSRPLTSDDPNDYQFKPGKGKIAFAVWQGGAGNRGGRKHWSFWTNYAIKTQQ